MKISSVFENKQKMPAKYTCDGANINPEIKIEGVPAEATSLVLIVDDPDSPSGVFTHWLMWNMAPETAVIAENSVPKNTVVGLNDFGDTKYGGPCPHSGIHRYRFQIYALDTHLALPQAAKKADLQLAITGHILDQDILTGVYSR
jgi:hypothetical protein